MGYKPDPAGSLNNMVVAGRTTGKNPDPYAYTAGSPSIRTTAPSAPTYDTYDAYRRADANVPLAEALVTCVGKFTRHVDHMVHQMRTQGQWVSDLIEVSKTNQELVTELLQTYVTDMKVAQGTADELRRRNAELEAQLDALRG